MAWYRKANQITALRKHVMRVDLHVHAGDLKDFKDEQLRNQSIKSILAAAVITGLDVIGIVSHDGPQMGQIAQQISKQENYDLYVIPGHEYLCSDKFRIIGYNVNQPIPPGMTYEQAATWIHKNKGYVLVTDMTRRQSQTLNKLKGTVSAPDGIELYNTAVGWYMDLDIDEDYQEFMNSAAKSANSLENTNVYTLINRKELERSGLIPAGTGMDYVPKYLQKVDNENTGENQNV
jgi:predicted metal-dependent phosphoesterase TrpH